VSSKSPYLKWKTDRLVIDNNVVVLVVTLEGTDIGGFMGLAPSGKTVQRPGRVRLRIS
jgi:predicted ester cyclase